MDSTECDLERLGDTSVSEPVVILYEDEHLVVVNKPSGVFVHRSLLCEPLARFALQEVRQLTGKQVNPVHRIDRATSGVLVFAFTKTATKTLCNAFKEKQVTKEYLAVVRGWTEDAGTIDYPLTPQSGKGKQDAVTDYETVSRTELPYAVRPYDTSRYSLVKVTPKTGRLHQIRRHFKHIFHPIAGDTTYGDGHHNKSLRKHLAVHRLLLHATQITIDHPVTQQPLTVTAPAPEDFAKLFPESFEKLFPA